MSSSRKEKLQCNGCHRLTAHILRASHEVAGGEDIDGSFESWIDCFEIFECQGCESVLVRRSLSLSLLGGEVVEAYFPARISRRQPKWLQDLPNELRLLLREVYEALQYDRSRLALMGIRAVIDVVFLEKIGDHGPFKEKLAAFEQRGYVGKRQREFLEAVLDAGNAAAHRGYAASTQELEFAMDIVENLLQAVYALESAAQHIREKTPPRQRLKQEVPDSSSNP